MASKLKTVVFITGANSGIGYETVKALVQSSRAYHIYLGSRSVDKGTEAAALLQNEFPESPSSIEAIQVDVSSDTSITAAYEKVIQAGYLDVLVNNAGHSLENRVPIGELTMREAWNQMFDVNVTGAQILTHIFAPLLLKSSDPRLLFLSSGLAQLTTMSKEYYPGPLPKAGWPKQAILSPDGYRSTKTALNMMMLNWHWTLKEDGVKVWSISPGWLATNLGNCQEKLKALGAGDPSVGGILIRQVIEGERDADVGKVVAGNDGIQSF